MFVNFFLELRRAKVPVSLREYLTLMEGMRENIAAYNVEDFYYLSRAALVKDERNIDKFDRVFGHCFNGIETPGDAGVDIPEEWLRKLAEKLLTEEEKRQMRATDSLARDILDRVENMSPETMRGLHGRLRTPRTGTEPAAPPWWDPAADASVRPEREGVLVSGVRVARGSRVRLRPARRGADAQDMFLAGRAATVHAVFLDVDGERHLAVTVDDDPAAEVQDANGRYRYFSPDEVEPLSPEAEVAP
jgi:uncharacterized protein with von Willebrand factor type A (vWA) domain